MPWSILKGSKKIDSTKTVMIRKFDTISLEAAYKYLHALVQTKAARRDAMPCLETP